MLSKVTTATRTVANPNFAVNLPAAVGTGSGGALGLTLGSIDNTVNLAAGTYDMQVDYVRVYRSLVAGDTDKNGIVNAADFTKLAQNFGDAGTTWDKGDFNGDGKSNAMDFNALSANFGKTTLPSWALPGSPALGTVVPEPASALAVCVLTMSRRKRHLL